MKQIDSIADLKAEFYRFFASASQAKILVLHALLGLLAERLREDYMVRSIVLVGHVGALVESFDGQELARKTFEPIVQAMTDFPDLTEEEAEELRQCLKQMALVLMPFSAENPPDLQDYLQSVFEAKTVDAPEDVVETVFSVLPSPAAAVVVLMNANAPGIDVSLTGNLHFPPLVVTASIREYFERLGYRTEARSKPFDERFQGAVDIFNEDRLELDAFFTSAYLVRHLLNVTINQHRH